jgi:hypothetical protein
MKHICVKCHQEKDESEFARKANTPTGRDYRCKKCFSEYRKNWRDGRRDIERAHAHQYYLKRIDKIKDYAKNHKPERWASNVASSHNIHRLRSGILELVRSTKNCPICGCELTYDGNRARNSASLDRIHNGATGHHSKIEDFWIICLKCNATKGDRTMEQFVEYCEMVSSKFKMEG